MNRRSILRLGLKAGAGLAGGAFVLGRTGVTIVGAASPEGAAVPAEPSFMGTFIYSGVVAYAGHLHPLNTIAQERATMNQPATPALPAGVTLQKITIAGFPAEIVRTSRALPGRAILYTHGGGFAVPLQDQDRAAAAQLSQATGAWVLLPDYRLAPEHPFPASLDDCVAAYHWLRNQGVAAGQTAIIGGSAGGNLALAVAVALQQRGETLPAALVAMSPVTDQAMTGATYRTKAAVDPILGGDLPKNTFLAYTDDGATDPRNPLVSPLYADLHGFPPTLLQVGTQEVLLSDSTRLADRMKAAGVAVTLEVWPGMFHGWQGVTGRLPEARLAMQHVLTFLRQQLAA